MQSQPAVLPRLFRIAIHVGDMVRAIEFYKRVLGIEGNAVVNTRYYLTCGDVILVLVSGETDARPTPDYLYFSVANLDDVHVRARELNALAAGKIHDDAAGDIVVRPWRERSFYAVDPWGNKLCFVDATTLFTGKR